MKNLIYKIILPTIIMVIFFGLVDFFSNTTDGVYKFSFTRFIMYLILMLFAMLYINATDWSKNKIQKQLLKINIEQTTQKISYKLPWQYTLRTGFILLISAPFMLLPLPAFTIFLINTQSTDKSWIGILLLGIAAIVALVLWLQKLAFFIYKSYHAYKKGFFLYADSQGLEHCLFPAIAWQYVQSILPEKNTFTVRGTTFTHYGMSITLHAAWIQQHPIPSWWSYIVFIFNRTKQRNAQNVLYLPCNPLGQNAQIAVTELIVLHKKHTAHTKTWSPKLIELLTKYGAPNPIAWLEKEMDDMQKELERLNAKSTLTETEPYRVELYLKQLNDLFAPDGGKYAQDLIKNEKYYTLSFKHDNLMDRLNSINKILEHIENQENPTPEQITQRNDLEQKTLDIIKEIHATHNQITQEITRRVR